MRIWRAITIAFVSVGLLAAAKGSGAQSSRPLPVVPDPRECNVEPRSQRTVEAIIASGTPTPRLFAEWEDQLPQGEVADSATVNQIVAAARTYVACLNASDWPRVLALQTERGVRDVLNAWLSGEPISSLYETAERSENFGGMSGAMGALLEVRDVRVLDDGRVGAVVVWGRPLDPRRTASTDDFQVTETNFHIFVRENDRWLLDDEISGWRPVPEGTPGPDESPRSE